MEPFELICTLGDAHLYKNHVEQARMQIEREPFPFPELIVSGEVADLPFEDIKLEHFDIVGYKFHPTIKALMAI